MYYYITNLPTLCSLKQQAFIIFPNSVGQSLGLSSAGRVFFWCCLGSLTWQPSSDSLTGPRSLSLFPSHVWALLQAVYQAYAFCGLSKLLPVTEWVLQENKGRSCNVSWSLGSETHNSQFHHCLLVQTSHKTNSDSRSGDIDSIFWWEELQNIVAIFFKLP